MVKSRLPFFLLLAAFAAALSFFVLSSSDLVRWAGVSASLLVLGFGLGLLWRQIRAGNYVVQGTATPDFSPELLATTINEMREGLLVIDAEMRVLASNRVVQHL